MGDDFQRQEELFHAALERPAAERSAFLDQACGDDAALRARLAALLGVHVDQQSRDVAVSMEQFLVRGALGLRVARYEVIKEIGRGGFGLVYLARDTHSRRYVALKVPRPELLFSADARRRFLAEGQTVAALQHPNITRVFDVGEAEGVCYMVSEYCPGPSLDLWLLQNSLTPRQSAQLIERLAQALHYVHSKGVLHRDLKPSNILLWPQEGETTPADDLRFHPQLTDFGLAKFVEQNLEETNTSIMLGTPLYMAPEQAECRRDDQGPWTDVYGLGAILYHLLVGAPPFAGGGLLSVLHRVRNEELVGPRKRRASVPQALDSICRKCLAKEPPDRYRTAEELADDLARYLRGEKVQARSLRWRRRFELWRQQPQRMPEAGAWTIVLNVGLTAWMLGNIVAVRAIPEWSDEDVLAQSIQSLIIIGLFHLPQIVMGWLMIRRHGWAMLTNTLVSSLLAVVALSPFFSPVPPVFTSMYPTRLSLWNVHWFLAILFVSQAALSLFAYQAYRKWRNSGSL